MFNTRKYLKIRSLESILYGGPEATEFNYELEASHIGDASNRTRNVASVEDEIKVKEEGSDAWYEYEYDQEKNQVSFNLLSE